MNRINENYLISRVANGEESAFTEMYGIYRVRVFGFAYRMTIDREIAEDITHDAFVVLIEHPERFSSERGSLLTFLCAIARNLVMNHLRRRHRTDVSYDEIGNFGDVVPRAEDDPLADLLNGELAGEVESCVARLPPLQREALILREFEDLTYEEISKVTDADLNTVKARLYRARRTLARDLAAYMKRQNKEHHELC